MLHVGVGLAIGLLTWLGLRRLVGAPLLGQPGRQRLAVLALDGFAPLTGFVLFLLPTARPVMAGLGILSLGLGMGVADRVKRAVLDEPVVFADRAELLEVVRHPRLYLAFVGVWRMALGTLACVAVVAGLIRFEPPLWHMSLPGALALAGVAAVIGRALFVLPGLAGMLPVLARFYARLRPTRDPAADAARFGLLATCIIQATLARTERDDRQRAAQARRWAALPADAGPIVIVQGESFVDARRLHPELAGRLPNFARIQREAALHGRLTVPCWGANTIRSELAVLTGLGEDEVGLDRYNPYEHFARVPLPSLASTARAAGYRTICLHPYDAGFYYRDRVMPLLGFDRFVGIEGFADAPRDGPYVSDIAVAERAAALIREHGPRLLLFLITMENHGPWDAEHTAPPASSVPESWRGLADGAAAGRWLRHLDSTDAMIPILRDAIGAAGWLMFYGDHQPSLAGPFHAPGAPDRRTDYAIWQAGRSKGERRDLAAEDLSAALLGAMSSPPAGPIAMDRSS